ncbi:MAG: ATPase, partial [Telluria sp.]
MTPTPTAPLDLSGCEREPIRTPGSIQPHGFLLTVSKLGEVFQASANLARWIGVEAQAASGLPLAEVIGSAAAQQLAPELSGDKLGDRPLYLCTLGIGGEQHFDVLGHAWDGVIVLEFEAADRA